MINFEYIRTGQVIKPPNPIKVIFLLRINIDDKFKKTLKIKKNLFYEFQTILLSLSFLILYK